MNVFITGGSGYIGSAVVDGLLASDHAVTALARSPQSSEQMQRAGCTVVTGDIRDPQAWLDQVGPVEVMIHLAATLGDDMGAAEKPLLDGLLDHADRGLERTGNRTRLVYTGGCWLFGAVGDRTAVEGTPFDPLPEFAFMVEHRARLFEAPQVYACVVHPAMVWDEGGGVIRRFLAQAESGVAPKVAGSLQTRWPLVHKDDLAQLYLRAAADGTDGTDYHGVAEPGVPVGDIAAAIAEKFGAPAPVEQPVAGVIAELGGWAAGHALDVTMDAPSTRESLGWAPSRPGIIAAF